MNTNIVTENDQLCIDCKAKAAKTADELIFAPCACMLSLACLVCMIWLMILLTNGKLEVQNTAPTVQRVTATQYVPMWDPEATTGTLS